MTPDDRTRTPDPDATRDPDDPALDAGLAAAFGGDTTNVRTPSADPEAGTVIAGRYKLSERIGEGGMGSVWAAHQTEPVKRKVAVKLIKAGMDSKAVLARFEAERQALAVMDHPHIAKVLDGGLHDGRPYFVMELVKGVPITQFCDARKLTPQQRLELFIPVCQAIQHAHQKGVIHRDIKPGNVLVALYDDRPVPKVIDFGVAKATGGALTDRTLETGFGAVVGTPAYMSPEQASLNNLDIDTRSDVYALGVLLYELLTGSPPFSKKELEKKGLLEVLRVVREEEPPRPSHKLSTADALPTLSANRGTEPKKLTGLLRNELDWIVMKALEKDRTRRYDTANGFAADVTRYLTGEPVQAHPPSTGYRLKKFVRRNRVQVIAGLAVFATLLLGMVGTTFGLLEAQRQAEFASNEATQKEAARAEEAEQRGLAEAREREAIEEKRKAVAAAAAERKATGLARSSLDVLTGQLVDRQFSQQHALSREDRQFLQSVRRIYESLDGAGYTGEDATLARATGMLWIAKLHFRLGEHRAAEDTYLQTEALLTELLRERPTSSAARFGVADALALRASVADTTGRPTDAEPPLREAAESLAALHAGDPSNTLYANRAGATTAALAQLYARLGRNPEAVATYDRATTILEGLLASNPADPAVGHQLALVYLGRGKLLIDQKPADAVPLFRTALDVLERTGAAKADNPLYRSPVSGARNMLAAAYRALGRMDEAQAELEQAVAASRETVRDFPGYPSFRQDLGLAVGNLGVMLRHRGKFSDAERYYRESNDIRGRLVEDFPTVTEYRNDLAAGLVNLAQIIMGAKPAEARKLLGQAVPHHLAALKASENHPDYRRFYRNNLYLTGMVCVELKDHAAAADAAEKLATVRFTPTYDYYSARVFSGAALVVGEDKAMSADEREKASKKYTARALELLARAVERGWRNPEMLEKDPAIVRLQKQPEFQAILSAHSKSPVKPEPTTPGIGK